MSQLDVIVLAMPLSRHFPMRSDMTIMPRGSEGWAGQRVKLRKGRYLVFRTG